MGFFRNVGQIMWRKSKKLLILTIISNDKNPVVTMFYWWTVNTLSFLNQWVLDTIHTWHQGVTKCLERIWFLVTRHNSWNYCQTNQTSQGKAPLITTTLPEKPWERVGVIYSSMKGKHYLVVSKYIEILYLPNTNTKSVVLKLKCTSVRFGVPEYMI